jgi:hypothetical protein
MERLEMGPKGRTLTWFQSIAAQKKQSLAPPIVPGAAPAHLFPQHYILHQIRLRMRQEQGKLRFAVTSHRDTTEDPTQASVFLFRVAPKRHGKKPRRPVPN